MPPSDECASETPGDPATIVIGRTGAIDNPLTVRLFVAGTATAGVDYQALPTIEVSLRSGLGYEIGVPYLFEVHLQDAQQNAQVTSIEYRPTGQGTTGDLSADNPDGTNGTPPFMGGYRFFPDAATYLTGNTSRNIVRIRATVNPARANICVYFRVFDVDDPSADATIDPQQISSRSSWASTERPGHRP